MASVTYTVRDVSEDTATCVPQTTRAAQPASQPSRAGGEPTQRAARTATISVIIPALNEQNNIERTLRPLITKQNIEVIVVDGGSTDGTVSIAKALGATVVGSAPGRARQMNAGARLAEGETLLFLHADTVLPRDFDHHIQSQLSRSNVVAGAFRLGLDADAWSLGVLKRLVNWRSSRLQRPYGDQALFMSAKVFERLGGFPDVPVMEDYILVQRLRTLGRIALADAEAVTSARRWTRHGVLRVTLINQLVILGYRMGLAPQRLAQWRERLC